MPTDGELTGRECPKCDTPLLFGETVYDYANSEGEHRQSISYIEYCDACGHEQEYEPSIDMEDD